MNATNYFPEVLADWIELSGQSDAEIASAIGVKRVTVWRAKTGKHASLELLVALASHLNRPVDVLLRGETAKKFARVVPSA